MAVNMSSLWDLIGEVTGHTTEIVDLVILGVIIACAYGVGNFITGILKTGLSRGKK